MIIGYITRLSHLIEKGFRLYLIVYRICSSKEGIILWNSRTLCPSSCIQRHAQALISRCSRVIHFDKLIIFFALCSVNQLWCYPVVPIFVRLVCSWNILNRAFWSDFTLLCILPFEWNPSYSLNLRLVFSQHRLNFFGQHEVVVSCLYVWVRAALLKLV